MTDPIVSVDSLEKVYRGGHIFRKTDVYALRGVSLTAHRGDVFGLLGPNGAGKTTLIKILLGVISGSGGKASLFGSPAGSTATRRRVGYLPESLRVDRHHTARTALSFYGRLSGLSGATIREKSDDLLKLVGLAGRDRESVRRFSKGMLQRLGLAQALLHDPDLLVLDEPTDGLDPLGRSEVRRVIERLRDAGKTIFLNSHILHEVEMVCTHLAIMNRGRLLGAGSLSELRGGGFGGDASLIVDIEMIWPRSGDVDLANLPAVEQLQLKLAIAPENDPLTVQQAECIEIEDRVKWQARIGCVEQSSVDRIVDAVRDSGGSLVRLQPRHATLEDTFMRLVTDDEASRNG